MPYRKEQFVNGEIYHITLRALDNNLIFKDIDDHYRGIFSLYEFNTTTPVKIRERRKIRAQIKKAAQALANPSEMADPRDKLVELLCFSEMPNHIHLLVRQIKERGISKYMQKTGAGLGGYLNRKYNRKGHVFQNRFNAVHIKTEDQLRTVFVYIHTNSISLVEPKWKEEGIRDPERVIKFLVEEYRWSSLFDYLGKRNFPSVTDREFLTEIMGGPDGCLKAIKDWVRYKGEIKEFPELALE
jgi:putative transposase